MMIMFRSLLTLLPVSQKMEWGTKCFQIKLQHVNHQALYFSLIHFGFSLTFTLPWNWCIYRKKLSNAKLGRALYLHQVLVCFHIILIQCLAYSSHTWGLSRSLCPRFLKRGKNCFKLQMLITDYGALTWLMPHQLVWFSDAFPTM